MCDGDVGRELREDSDNIHMSFVATAGAKSRVTFFRVSMHYDLHPLNLSSSILEKDEG